MIDQTISHFRIVEKLGAGGMGVVFKAVDTRLERPVALKFLPENMVQDVSSLERFRREAKAASALNHPNICTIYDVGDAEDSATGEKRSFIAMEFIDGETLRQHINGKPLPMDELLSLGIQIADALDVAHTSGIIHRDIKPSNVFVTKRGQAKVLDFGLAKLLAQQDVLSADPNATASSSSSGSQGSSVSIVGVISGTPAYMSPEHVRGDDLDARADVFALGLLLYEMATGKQAFSGRTGGAIIEAILTKKPAAVQGLNPEAPAQLEEIISKCMEKDREKRYQTAAEVRADLQLLKRATDTGQMTVTQQVVVAGKPHIDWRKALAGVAVGMVLLGVGGWFYLKHAHALGRSDTVVLADFVNKTGDPIFDDTLRQGLAAQLQQSPFLSLVPEQKIQQTLKLMGKSPESRLVPAVAEEVCLRSGSKAYLTGTIANIGTQYVIGVNAVNCATGESIAQEQVMAEGKEGVLKALGSASTSLREKLGESLKTVKKLDTPIDQATTPSLEALQSYSMGRKMMQVKGDYAAAVPLFKHAIEADPNFAMAYAMLGTTDYNLGEKLQAARDTKNAYELRSRVSEWEKLYIESHYYHFVTGDLNKARQTYELWLQIYPRESSAANNLGEIYMMMGQHEKSRANYAESLKLSQGDSLGYSNLVAANLRLNRPDEAKRVAAEAQAKGFDNRAIHQYLYEAAFLKNDAAGMAEHVKWGEGKPGVENVMLSMEAGTAAYGGKLDAAREFSREAETSASRAGEHEMAAGCAAAAALWEALYGNPTQAKERAYGTLALSNGRDAQFVAALALAINGDAAGATTLLEDLENRFPEDTIVRFNYVPTLRAQVALIDPGGAEKAIEALRAAAPYELGIPGGSTFWTSLYPVYVRGEAYLAAGKGAEAATEFQKIADWPGVVVNEPIGALAQLGLARAYVNAGDMKKGREAYDRFFGLWNQADTGIPVLHRAQWEYQKLGK
ncbi:MAG TPA: protein kinase [Candidatus Saccharimonadales bacterium]|nr:protein kinase [Candidatus Saccharimonadales bacterium]